MSLPSSPDCSRVPHGLALLCDTKIANADYALIEHWKQACYKEADLLFITSHSLPFFLTDFSAFHRTPIFFQTTVFLSGLLCSGVSGALHFPLHYVGEISVDGHIDMELSTGFRTVQLWWSAADM